MRFVFIAVLLLASAAAAQSPTPTASPAGIIGWVPNTATPTGPSATPTITKTPTLTATATLTQSPLGIIGWIQDTRTPTGTPTQTDTPTITPTRTPTHTRTDTPTATRTRTSTRTNTPTISPTITWTPTPTGSPGEEWVTRSRFQAQLEDVPTTLPGARVEVCTVWTFPFARCAATGDHPGFACTTSLQCGTSTPCTGYDYQVAASPLDSASTVAAFRFEHVTLRTALGACVSLVNQDAANSRSATVRIWGYRAGRTYP